MKVETEKRRKKMEGQDEGEDIGGKRNDGVDERIGRCKNKAKTDE